MLRERGSGTSRPAYGDRVRVEILLSSSTSLTLDTRSPSFAELRSLVERRNLSLVPSEEVRSLALALAERRSRLRPRSLAEIYIFSGFSLQMGFQLAGRAISTAVWIAVVSLFMELLGFSTQKWLTARGLGTVLLTIVGLEVFTNFLLSIMIHTTCPFIVNDQIQTVIEGYEVSGTVKHVGWWSSTIIRDKDREAVHIPNHKFTVNVLINLSQKTHWHIKTHIAISLLDVNKIGDIVADMRKVLAENPQIEQQRLHRRVFLDNINPENQALMILVSCYVKTSHFEEYLCVKKAIFKDFLRLISHHGAWLVTPLCTDQNIYGDAGIEIIPFSDTIFASADTANRSLLLIEPSSGINSNEKKKLCASARTSDALQGAKPFKTSEPKVTTIYKALP